MSFLKSRAFFVFRVVASVSLIVLILSRADLGQVLETMRGVGAGAPLLVFAFLIVNLLISAWRWWELLHIHGIPHRFADLVRWYFIAQFFNNFLPTSIGGDGFRVYRTYSRRRYRSTAFLVVFMERLSGLAALLVLGWIAAGWMVVGSGDAFSRRVFLGGTAIGVASVIALLVLVWLVRRYGAAVASRLPSIVTNVLEHARDYRRNPRATARALLTAFGFHLSALLWTWCLARAVGADISFAALLVVMSLVSVVSVLPLSINGIGLVDGAFIVLAGQYGMDHESGLTFVLLQRALVALVSVIGMLFYLLERRRAPDVPPEPLASGADAVPAADEVLEAPPSPPLHPR